MATFWTLSHTGTGGAEKSFQDWGFTSPMLRLVSQAQSTFTVRVPGVSNLTAASPVPFEQPVTIRRNRTLGGGGTYSGGEIVFQGRQVTRRGSANSESPADTLTFADAWYDLDNLVFQQQWNHNSGPATDYFSRLNLFQRYDVVTGIAAAANSGGTVVVTLSAPMTLTSGDYVTMIGLDGIVAPVVVTVTDSTHFSVVGHLNSAYSSGGQVWPLNQRITNGAQVQEIIAFAAGAGVAIQAGTIDLAYPLPIYPVKAVSCASALQICLKPQPDAMTWIDYTSTPPTFNCRARASLASASVPYGDGDKHSTSEITPRFDLQPPAVVLQYQKTSTVGTQVLTDFATDAYPGGSTGRAVRSLVVPIDLRGANVQDLSILVQAKALPNLPSGDAPSLAWWKNKKPEMANYLSLAMVASSLSVTDDAGNDYTSTWASLMPNEYVKGEILDWMGVRIVQVKIAAKFTYLEKDPSNRTWHAVGGSNPHVISTRIKLTNSPAGQKVYGARQSFDPGETAPANLAQTIYNTLQVLQYEGSHVIIDAGINIASALIGPKNRLQITGGATAWATMDATIQSVDFDFFHDRCEIGFGPAKHLAPGDLEELLQFWRWRTVYDNPNLRVSGRQSQTQTAQLGGDTAAENTTNGNPPPEIHTVQATASGGTLRIQSDANSSVIQMRIEDGSGAAVTGKSALYMTLGDLEPDLTARIARFQWLNWKDPSDCSSWKARVLMTDPEPA